MDVMIRKKKRRAQVCDPLEEYRDQAKEAVEGLFYGNDVVQRIKHAKTEADIARIMKTARERSLDND